MKTIHGRFNGNDYFAEVSGWGYEESDKRLGVEVTVTFGGGPATLTLTEAEQLVEALTAAIAERKHSELTLKPA